MNLFPPALPAVFLAASACAAISAPDHPPLLSKTATSPTTDGKINPAEWRSALSLGKLPSADPSETLPDTEAWITFDAHHFYIAVRCAEPLPDKIKTVTMGDEIKGPVWNDDSVEVFLDLGNTGKSIYQLVANTEGTLYDSLIINNQQSPLSWNSGAVARTHIGRDYWEIEIAIPLQTLDHQPQRGEVIAINIGRNRYATGQRQSASFAGKSFLFPDKFRRLLVEGPINTGGLSLISTKRGPFFPKAGGMWEFQLLESPEQPGEVTLRFPGSATPHIPRLQPGQRFITVPFEGGQAGAMNQCLFSYKGGEIYTGRYTLHTPQGVARIAETKEPLFKELLVPFPEGLAKRGIVAWAIELNRPLATVIPFRAGMEYSPEETPYREAKRDAATLITTTQTLEREPQRTERAAVYKIPWCIYLKNGTASKSGAPTFGKPGGASSVWFLDPRSTAAYLADAREAIALAKENPDIQWLFAGDEVWEKMHRTLLLALDEKETYPELLAADKEVREKYGFGRYGFPESSRDTNPFRWIATYRWEIDKMNELAASVRAMIDRDAPHLKFLSWDSMTGHRPYGISSWGRYFDVVTAQIYPARGEHRDHVGFTTRLYSNLIGESEFWPVAHTGHFPASYSTAEVEEILSQAFRSGATGLHLWPGDHINEAVRKSGTTITERIGAPERWNVVRHLVDRLTAAPFRVAQPTPDTAIFYSNTSYQSTGGPLTFHAHNHGEWLYSILGPQLRSAIRFVDESIATKDREALSSYKAVYIPFMPIADDAEYDALEAYVAQGGRLIICDPGAFAHRSDGTKREEGALLPPLASQESRGEENIEYVNRGLSTILSALGPTFTFAPKANGQILATANGQPAILQKKHGEGVVTFFAQNPLQPLLLSKPEWRVVFEDLQQAAGAKGDHKVWRFRFPPTPPLPDSRPKGLCLTGNYFEWVGSEPQPMANSIRGGTYTLEHVDTANVEPVGKPIPFASGRLHDRIKGASAPNEAPASDYILPCRADTPWHVQYDFPQPLKADTVRIFYSGNLPDGTLETSADGATWQKVGEWKNASPTKGKEVKVKTLSTTSDRTAHFRLRFEPTTSRQLALVEIDIWGSEELQ